VSNKTGIFFTSFASGKKIFQREKSLKLINTKIYSILLAALQGGRQRERFLLPWCRKNLIIAQ
jgi:hypothetical protein